LGYLKISLPDQPQQGRLLSNPFIRARPRGWLPQRGRCWSYHPHLALLMDFTYIAHHPFPCNTSQRPFNPGLPPKRRNDTQTKTQPESGSPEQKEGAVQDIIDIISYCTVWPFSKASLAAWHTQAEAVRAFLWQASDSPRQAKTAAKRNECRSFFFLILSLAVRKTRATLTGDS
jgi:hypothetical protein